MANVQYKNPTEADIENIAEVLNRSREELQFHQDITAKEVYRRFFKVPGFNLEGYWLAVVDKEAVGCGGIKINPQKPNTGYIDIEVIPEHRSTGIGKKILELSLDYLKSKSIKFVHHIVDDNIKWRQDLFSNFGFKDVNHTYSVSSKSENTHDIFMTVPGIEFKDYSFKETDDKDIRKIIEIYNSSPSEQPSYKPISIDMLTKLRDSNNEPKNVIFARAGEDVVGVCIGIDDTIYRKENNTKTGFIYMVGVSKPYRRKGIGRSLISREMRLMQDHGTEIVFGDIDARNSASLRLCDLLGFKVRSESIAYQLEL